MLTNLIPYYTMNRLFTLLVALFTFAQTVWAQQYTVGDIVSVNGVKAIVFTTTPNVRVVTCEETLLRWANTKQILGTNDRRDGRKNSPKFDQSGLLDSIAGYSWCAKFGQGWYMPSLNEVHAMYKQVSTLNYELGINGFKLLATSDKDHKLWSSTEVDNGFAAVKVFSNGHTASHPKSYRASLRAARVIEPTDNVEIIYAIAASPRYKVGDLFERGDIKGVVFDVSEDGRHGKIVSLHHSEEPLYWATKGAELRYIAALNNSDGRENMKKVANQRDWEFNYPAFNWVDNLGPGWYLPSEKELLKIFAAAKVINPNLKDKLTSCWSSTEYKYQWSNDNYCARVVGFHRDTKEPLSVHGPKQKAYRVRAVRMF